MMDEVLPKVAAQNLANYIDVFCEIGYFTPEQMKKILLAGANFQLKSKVHVNQFSSIGGVQVAVEAKSLTVDHLEVMTENDIQVLKKSQTIAVALPICSLFLDIPYTPVRRLIAEGIPIVLASDFNPGSSPSYNLSLAFHLACSQMKLNVNEAFNALTYNAAFALELQHEMGSIQKGKRANLIITKEGFDLVDFPYWVGRNIIEDVLVFK
jgi:imidazolonepropionase